MARGPDRVLAVWTVVAALALAGCAGSKPTATSPYSGRSSATQVAGTQGTGTMADCGVHPNTCNSGKTKAGGTVQFAIPEGITGWNILAADSANVDFGEVMQGLLPGTFVIRPDLQPALNTDLLSSADLTSTNPETIVYRIKHDAVWNDGTPIDAADFVYAWKTNNLASCPKCGSAFTAGYKQIASVTGQDGGKTVTVVFRSPFAEWKNLFPVLYPAHIAENHGGSATAAGLAESFTWFDKTQPTWSGGPYQIRSVVKDTAVTEVPNPKWYGATKPQLDQLIFRTITDKGQQVLALQNNEIQALYFSPSQNDMQTINGLHGVNTFLGKGLAWEHLDFNEKNPLLADRKLRTAIFTAIDRKAIINRVIGGFVPNAAALNSHMYFPGEPGYRDNITPADQGSGDVTRAKAILIASGYTGVGTALLNKAGKAVRIRCSYQAGGASTQQICEVVQTQLAALGIKVTPTPVHDLLGALSTGDFDLFDFSWVDSPFPVSNAQTLFDRSGGADFGGNDDPAMESLLNQASMSTDPAMVQRLINEVDVDLTNDAYELPLYQKPILLAARADVVNIRGNTAMGPPYNDHEWGIRAP